MPAKKKSATGAKKKTAAKRSAARKSAPKRAKKTQPQTPAAQIVEQAGDRLSEVARTIGSTVGDLVSKTKKVLKR